MGKLTITGKASHEYSYDLMEITVRFQAHEKTSSTSMEKVLAQCEEFLSLMHEEGISADSIRIGSSSWRPPRTAVRESHMIRTVCSRLVIMIVRLSWP